MRGILNTQGNHVLIAKADGSGERVLADRKGFDAGSPRVSWSEDGKNLASTDDDPGNPTVNFHGEQRSNRTHESKTDPEANGVSASSSRR